MDEQIKMVLDNLEANNIKAYFVQKKEEVVPVVSGLLHEGDLVTAGGSQSLFEAAVIDYLRCGRYQFLDRYQEGLSETDIRDIYAKALDADAYFCSCNAVTTAGELYHVDGKANRICAISYGPKSVIMVVGKNKIVKDIPEAIYRVKTVVSPQICKRSGRRTFCCKHGHCISIEKGLTGMTAGCHSPDRACCSYLVIGKQREKHRIKVILVNEDLGF